MGTAPLRAETPLPMLKFAISIHDIVSVDGHGSVPIDGHGSVSIDGHGSVSILSISIPYAAATARRSVSMQLIL